MFKVQLYDTYGYENFISDTEQLFLLDWIKENEFLFPINESKSSPYGSRKYLVVNDLHTNIFELVRSIKNRIIDLEKIDDWVIEPNFEDGIGINKEGGNIHLHSDPNLEGYTHVRYNVILSYPNEGGHSIYNGKINELKEKMVWRCVAGKVMHGSTPVIGDKPRVTLSLGFQIKDKIKKVKSLI